MRLTKSQLRVVRCAEQVAIAERLIAESGVGLLFVTRRELAALLKVSVRTVDEMVAAKEVTPFRLRGVLVRFFVPAVIAELKAATKTTGARTIDCGAGGELGKGIEQENAEKTEGGHRR